MILYFTVLPTYICCTLFQLQRNILATCPRVTRFKIDWGMPTESENKPPAVNPENESNQMSMDSNIAADKSKTIREETMDAPVLCKSNACNVQQGVSGGSFGGAISTDSNGLDLNMQTPLVSVGCCSEPMQM